MKTYQTTKSPLVRLPLERKQFQAFDGILYHENLAFPNQLCIVVPESLLNPLLKESYSGHFTRHLAKEGYAVERNEK